MLIEQACISFPSLPYARIFLSYIPAPACLIQHPIKPRLSSRSGRPFASAIYSLYTTALHRTTHTYTAVGAAHRNEIYSEPRLNEQKLWSAFPTVSTRPRHPRRRCTRWSAQNGTEDLFTRANAPRSAWLHPIGGASPRVQRTLTRCKNILHHRGSITGRCVLDAKGEHPRKVPTYVALPAS